MNRSKPFRSTLLVVALAGTTPAFGQDLVRLPEVTDAETPRPAAVVAQDPLLGLPAIGPGPVSVVTSPPLPPADVVAGVPLRAANVCKLQDRSDVWLLGWRADRAGCHDCGSTRGRYGDSVDRVITYQIANGEAANMILFHYHFASPGGDSHRLTTHGVLRLTQFVARLASTNYPLIVEADDRMPELNELRRQEVVARLTDLGVAMAEQRVIVDRARTRGITGEEASVLHQSALQRFRMGGSPMPSSRSSGSSSSSSSSNSAQ